MDAAGAQRKESDVKWHESDELSEKQCTVSRGVEGYAYSPA